MSTNTCRVCLAFNLKLSDVPINLKNTYERISREKYNEVGYPIYMCFICQAVLRKCHKFMETAQDTNRLLKACYNQRHAVRDAKPLQTYTITKLEPISLGNEQILSEDDIKKEEVDLAEQRAGDKQADNSQIYPDVTLTEIKQEKIEIEEEIQVSSEHEMPKYLQTVIKIEEIDDSEADVYITDDGVTNFNTAEPKHKNTETNTQNEKKLNICDICKKYFTPNSSLTQNAIKKVNENKKTYPCNQCSYKAAKNHMLTRHMKIHSGEKPYSCTFCNYKCIQKHSLTSHMRSHTGEKPFTCHICEYKASFKKDLINHIRTHTGEKPFACGMCSYKSASKSALTFHLITHSGERPYSCDECHHNYAYRSNLKRHILTKHLKNKHKTQRLG